MIDIETYALAKAYTDKAIEGAGAIKGKNCVITEIEDVGNTHIVHFQWTLDDGTVETDTMTVEDGDLVEASETNGNIKINGVETQVYNDAEIKADIDAIDDIISTDEVTKEGNPLNFTTLSAQTAKSTILTCQPIQDFHGYDKPWTGGAGKNLLPMTVEGIKSANTTGTWSDNKYTINNIVFTILTDLSDNIIGININGTPTTVAYLVLCDYLNTTELASDIINGLVTSVSVTYRISSQSDFVAIQDLYNESVINDNGSNRRLSLRVNGAVDNKLYYPMIRLSTVSDSTFEPYSNLCPITGRTEIGILGCGVNLLDVNEYSGSEMYLPSRTFKVMGNYVHRNIIFSGSGVYNFKLFGIKDGIETAIDEAGYAVSLNDIRNYVGNYDYVRASGYSNNSSNRLSNIMLAFSDDNTDMAYEPYQESNDLTISLGQTVYGGTIDVENGVLVVDRGYFELDGSSDEQWEKAEPTSEIYHRRFLTKHLQSLGVTSNRVFDAISNEFKNSKAQDYDAQNGVFILRYVNNTNRIDITCDSITSVSDWETYLSNNPLQVCYELATPITVNLTPHTINLLKGVNNISTDGDKITLTYRDGKVATLGDLTSAVDELDSKIDESKILTDTATGDKYILVVTNGVLSVEQISN